jgi:GGDEF domain-containing protein
MGGDEFTIILEGLRTGSDASRPVESLLKAFAEPFRVANRSHYIDASIGIAIYPENGEDASTLLKCDEESGSLHNRPAGVEGVGDKPDHG